MIPNYPSIHSIQKIYHLKVLDVDTGTTESKESRLDPVSHIEVCDELNRGAFLHRLIYIPDPEATKDIWKHLLSNPELIPQYPKEEL